MHGHGSGKDNVDVEGVGENEEAERQRSVAGSSRVFPELVSEQAQPGEEQVYSAAAEWVVEWREAWTERRSANYAPGLAASEAQTAGTGASLGRVGVIVRSVPWGRVRREHEVQLRQRRLRDVRGERL